MRALAAVLSALTVTETNPDALESQLNALLELGQTGFIRTEDVASVANIDRANLKQPLSEYVADLLQED